MSGPSCSFCGSEAERPRSRWTSSGRSPWCPACHARFAHAPATFARKVGRPSETPEGFIAATEAAARIGVTLEQLLDDMKRQKLRGVERVKRVRGADKQAFWYVHEQQLASWIRQKQFSSQQFDVAPRCVRSGFSKRSLGVAA